MDAGLPERAEARTTCSEAGTAMHALVGFRFGWMRGFQNGLKPEQRTRNGLKPEQRARNGLKLEQRAQKRGAIGVRHF